MIRQGVNSNGEVLRSAFVEHEKVPAPHADDGMTRQEFADECDINVLMARYEKTGVLNHFNARQPQYLDVSEVPDLATSLLYLQEAETAFMRLPAAVRKEFDNDPVKFVDFASDPENLSRMREWGLAAPEKAPDALQGPGATPDEGGEPSSNAGAS